MEIEVQVVIKNKLGEFFGEKIKVDKEGLNRIMEASKGFYNSGFELHCQNGDFIVFPPDVIKNSILKILTNKDKE